MTLLRALVALLRLQGFRRLFLSRVTSQGSDGVFQVALAGHVLFNPEQATDALAIAAAFAVLLLPYSLIGPFAGVLLDLWPRRQVVVVSQLVRATAMLGVAGLIATSSGSTAFFCVVLLVFSVNRFVLSGLSAALPHVVERDQLVSANSVAPTCGSLAYIIGGAVGTGLRALGTDLVVVLVAAAGVAVAAFAASRLPFLGPDDDVPGPHVGQILASVAVGLVEALRTLPGRAKLLLALIFVTRLPMGFLLLQTVVLFRGGLSDAGGRGLVVAAAASAFGFTLAAFVTPWLSPRIGQVPYASRALLGVCVVVAAVGWLLTPWSVAVVGFVVGLASQCVKITVDSLLQAHVPDGLLGRAFAGYDMVYNAGLVAGAVTAAWTLPDSGLAAAPAAAIAAVYAVVGLALPPVWARARRADRGAGASSATQPGH